MVHVLLGGTGTLGQQLASLILSETEDRVRILARGEHRLNEMRRLFNDDRLSFFVGDVRDYPRLRLALTGADRVFHLAALKHVHTCEYDVLEAVKTNIEGTANVLRACLEAGVKQAVLVSTDKAVEPTTTYGATKMVAERIFLNGNSYSGRNSTVFFVVRYGNVLASQGSVLKIWKHQAENGEALTVVNPEMTRFWWRPEDAARFVLDSMAYGRPGDIYVPIMASCSLSDLAEAVAPGAECRHISGMDHEKLHEDLLSNFELEQATVMNERVIRVSMQSGPPAGEERFRLRLSSNDNPFGGVEELRPILEAM